MASGSKSVMWYFGNDVPAGTGEQNNPPVMNNAPKSRGKKKASGSSSRGSKGGSRKNASGSSGKRSGNAEMVSGSASGSQQGKRFVGQVIGNKRICFIFDNWNDEEKMIMDQELEKRSSPLPLRKICEQIAALLPHKSIRDVLMRIENLIKTGKLDKNNLRKISNDRQDNGSDHVHDQLLQNNVQPLGQICSNLQGNKDNGSNHVHQLLQNNAQTLGQICSNLNVSKIGDNIELFRQSWNNIGNILNKFNTNPGSGMMANMPPVPVQINEELFHLVFPQTELAKATLNPAMIEHSRSSAMGVNEELGNSALHPINILEESEFPIQMTHMQTSSVGGVNEELSKLSVMPDNNWEEPFNQNKNVAPPSPGGDLREFDFYLPDNPNDPDFMMVQKILSSQAVGGSKG